MAKLEEQIALSETAKTPGAQSLRPVTTLFMLMSADGKISTGAADEMDMDQDLPKIVGVKEGLHQYYEIEQTTDLWALNSGRVQAKIGVNEAPLPQARGPVSFVILDNYHLTEHGVQYFSHRAKNIVLVTSNREHPAYSVQADNLNILYYETMDLGKMLTDLRGRFGCDRVTLQTGGTLNGAFLREKLIDFVDVVVAPVLVGGRDTATLIDGESLNSVEELGQLGVLKLLSAEALADSYLRLRYQVIG